MTKRKEYTADLAYPNPSTVGEGCLWNAASNCLYWVDIRGNKVNRYDPQSGANTSWDVGQHVGTVVVEDDDHLIVALVNDIARLHLKTGQLEILTSINAPGIRFNDGKCDPQGRFWVGTMAYDTRPKAGKLYCLYNGGRIEEKIPEVTISNGLCWSKDGRIMYYIDSCSYRVVAYEFDGKTGALGEQKVIASFDEDRDGLPDGMCIDDDDNLWVACFGGSQVLHLNSSNGQILGSIALPCPNITSCAFGGENLNELYISSATALLSPEQLKKHPLSGSLFKAELPVTGQLSHNFSSNPRIEA